MMKILFSIVACVALSYAALCFLAWKFQTKLIFHPSNLPNNFQFGFQEDFEEVWLKAEDGVKLHGLWFHAQESRGTVLFFHGNAGAMDDWGHVAPDFLQHGYSVLVTDYRSFGKSEGKIESQEQLFADARKFWDFLEAKGENNILICGRSIGTGIATQLASKVSSSCLILETPYYSVLELAVHYFPFLPHQQLSRFPLETNLYIKNVKIPIYAIHGTSDKVIPFSHAQKLADEFARINFTVVKGGEHNDLGLTPEYNHFLKEALQQSENP